MSNLTLYFLNSSRAIRVAWLLEELGLTYRLVQSDRAPNGLSPPEFKAQIPSPLGKSPTITDGNVVVTESGAILEYLCENYDQDSRLLPANPTLRAHAREWLHAAEGTFAVHAMAILYARWFVPEEGQHFVPAAEERMKRNVHNDFNWLEGVLKEQRQQGKDWLVGDEVTVADIQMQFSIEFIFARKLGNGGADEGKWPEVEAWLKRTKEREAYKRAIAKTGYTLEGNFKQ